VGTEEKVQYLINKLGIPKNHIFNSRDASFLPDLMRETGGQGVDLVLNSLSGELLHASWKCVAPFGKLIELGKRDLAEFGNLEMEPFLQNRLVARFQSLLPN
jgi:NADPH:quinone reductase-like Zn-dependent oxidoreductase